MQLKDDPDIIPVVHVKEEDRRGFGIHRKTVNAQLSRLADAGLIKIVDCHPGRAWRVRLKARAEA